MAQSQNFNQRNQQPNSVRSPEPSKQNSNKNLSGNNNAKNADKSQGVPSQHARSQNQPTTHGRHSPNLPHQNKNKY